MIAKAHPGPGLLLLVGSAVCLTACSDPKAVSKANFLAVLEPVVADLPCRDLPAGYRVAANADTVPPFPIVMEAVPHLFGGADKSLLDSFVTAGLLTSTVGTTAFKYGSAAPVTKASVSYRPAAQQSDVRITRRRTADGGQQDRAVMCIGRGRVTDIVEWSEPADDQGRHVTSVTYHWQAVDISPKIASLPGADATAIAATKTATMRLTLTNTGWRQL